MTVKYDVVAITGKYTDNEGAEKNRYLKIGVVLETQRGGLMLKLEAVPTAWDGTAFLNDPKPKEGKPAQGKPSRQRSADDSDVPF